MNGDARSDEGFGLQNRALVDERRSGTQRYEKSTTSSVAGKQSFNHIYNTADPRAYYRTLEPLDYRMPHEAQPIFERCAKHLARLRDKPSITVLDLCSGYGVNGALLRHRVSLDDLYERYTSNSLAELEPEGLLRADQSYFGGRRRKDSAVGQIIGQDVAGNAIHYATAAGLIDRGTSVNLEENDPPAWLADRMQQVDLIIITGGMGYISPVTFRRLLTCTSDVRRPWIASFPLRAVDMGGFLAEFERFGLTDEVWEEDRFPQRRFSSDEERAASIRRLSKAGLGAEEEKKTGYLLADFHLARPAEESRRVSLDDLVVPPSLFEG